MKLVIVESPAKAKTINKYLGSNFKVLASLGHVREIPSKTGSVLPEEDFSIKYEPNLKASKHVNEIAKATLDKCDAVYLATDPDREGEAIAWHVTELLKSKNKALKSRDIFSRIVFNEITKKAVLAALDNPRKIDINLVNAQQARSALDYLVGFTLSPLLWRKLPGCKSAGRVQSVALRLICEREEEIEKFIPKEYWDIKLYHTTSKKEQFISRLISIDQEKLEKFSINNDKRAQEIVQDLQGLTFCIQKIDTSQQKRNPSPPFITSSLQQEASRKLGFTAKKTMQIAQKLYEGIEFKSETMGLITYMRTDGLYLSKDAVASIRTLIRKDFGDKYLPNSERVFKSKLKNAQEAHEAIRPTDINLRPEHLKNKLDNDQYKLYELIWKRTVACQMEQAIIDQVSITLISSNNRFTSKATGSVIAFDGFYKVYSESNDDIANDNENEDAKLLPNVKPGEMVNTNKILPLQHFTEPPPRYSEASLVKTLEELGIGRPSTYASIISVLQARKYVRLEKRRFFLEELGRLLTVFLVKFFSKYVEYDFTATLEQELDDIAESKIQWKELLSKFWSGFYANIQSVSAHKTADVIHDIEQTLSHHLFGANNNNKNCTKCANGILSLKLGKFGAFIGCNNYPQCEYKKSITTNADDNIPIDNPDKIIGTTDQGINIYLRKGPYGFYLQEGDADTNKEKRISTKKGVKKDTKKTNTVKRASIPQGISTEQIDLNLALKILNLPLNLGMHPLTNGDIILGNGRFGLYLKYQNKFVSVPKSMGSLDMQLETAIEILDKKLARKNE